MAIGLDATYSLGQHLSGVGVYSRKMLFGLADAHPEEEFYFYYRPQRFLRSLRDSLPVHAHRRLLGGMRPVGDVFHALNQRVHARARKTVTTFHDLFVMTGEYSSDEFRERFTAQASEAAERSDHIIAVSQFTAEQVHRLLKVPRERITVIPHGVDAAAAEGGPRERVVLFVGAIQKRKNVARLVRAFGKMPRGWRLVLAGAPDGFGAAEELAAVEASPRRADIRVAGYVSAEELDALYARASIFAFPSLDEGFGMPVLEAMARGVPVLTSDCSAMPEVAGGAALLADPHGEDGLAEALNMLAGDPELRAELVQRGYARAKEFSWQRAVNATWDVYTKLR